ncbi:MAG: PT domain-containing protein [Bacteroidaceae bacterium]|nr:PT domain-containing protein [Bacteroidaceae bacterium]
MMCLDNNCRSVLLCLIQFSSFCQTKDNKFDGWFFRSNSDLEAQTKLSKNVLKGALDALYKANVIDIIPQQKGKGIKQETCKYKVKYDEFRRFEDITIEDCYKNPDYALETCDYKHGAPSFLQTSQPTSQPTLQPTSQPTSLLTSLPTLGKSDNNVYNVYNIDNNNNRINKLLNNSNLLVDSNFSFSNKDIELDDMNECEYHITNSMIKEEMKGLREDEKPLYLKDSIEVDGGLDEEEECHISKSSDDKPTTPKTDTNDKSSIGGDNPVSLKYDNSSAPVSMEAKPMPSDEPSEMSIDDYNMRVLMDKIMRLVEMEKNNTKDDGLFYQAAEIYQLVYNEKTIKDACNSVRCVINNVLDDNYNPEE